MLRSGLNRVLFLGAWKLTDHGLHDLIRRHGCLIEHWPELADLRSATGLSQLDAPAAAMLDAGSQGAEWLQALRALPGLWGNTPVVAVGDQAIDGPLAVAGWIAPAAEERAVLAAIEECTGPLADHGLRDGEDPAYRLLRLIGRTRAAAMLGRLAEQLEDGLGLVSAGDPAEDRAALRAVAHRIAGAAGIYGFAELSGLWLRVERGESVDLPALLGVTQAVIRRIGEWRGR
jgi:hypothetical protein